MKFIQRALNELYLASDDTEEHQEHVDNAIELLQDGLEQVEGRMASEELCDMVSSLATGSDIDSIIYELEVINNEL